MKNIIFLSFANPPEQPLPTLREEEEHIFKLLALREKESHFSVYRDANTTQMKIIDYLNLYKEEIIVFHYSGHAGKDMLLLDDEAAQAKGIAAFLAQCPKLKLVVLNGCSTKGQVDRLMELDSNPVVISTNSPVEDRAATTFSKSFYQSLCQQYQTIDEAFEAGVAAAKTVSSQTIEVSRDIYEDKKMAKDIATWDISSKSKVSLEWRLPNKALLTNQKEVEPNVYLTQELLETFAELDEEVEFISRKKDLSESRKRRAILEALPLPISEQLRKLFAVRDARGSKHIFYDNLGYNRLSQIVATFHTLAELLTFIHLSQLWDVINQKNIKIKKDKLEELKHFFYLNPDKRRIYPLFHLIKTINEIFEENKIQNFLEEIRTVYPLLNSGTALDEAIEFIQTVNSQLLKLGKSTMPEEQAIPLSIDAEVKLAIIIKHLAFIIKYRMVSVKNIDVFNFRHRTSPSYNHTIIRLIQHFYEMEMEKEEKPEAMNTASVFLINDQKEYLNLTPFIIDLNAFDKKAPLAQICYFNVYEEKVDKYAFKHVYNPQENYLEIEKQDHFRVIKEQFDHFTESVFRL